MAGNLFLKIDFGQTPSVDTGARPYPGGQPLWVNTSVFLSGGVSQTQTKVGRPTTVKVRVSNLARGPVEDVRVDAYVMNPFVGFATPSQAVVQLQSNLVTVAPGSGAPVETDPHVLECKVAGPNGPEPWTPTAQQLQDSGGHLCLIANCYGDGDGAALPSGTPFDVVGDQHHGQRNISLLAASSFRADLITFMVLPAPEAETRTLVEVVPLEAAAIGAGEEWLLGSHPDVAVVGEGKRRRLVVVGRDGERFPVRFSRHPLEADLVVEGAEEGTAVGLGPFEEPLRAVLRAQVPPEGKPGTLHAVDIAQRTEKGDVLGGLRVLTLVTA